jgi:hypothetical protein
MILKSTYVLISIWLCPGVLYAYPTKILVKNETNEKQWVSGELEFAAIGDWLPRTTNWGFGEFVPKNSEVDITNIIKNVQGSSLSIKKMTIVVGKEEINLGEGAEVHIIISQQNEKIVTSVESTGSNAHKIIAWMAMKKWWNQFKKSFTDTWHWLFGYKKPEPQKAHG